MKKSDPGQPGSWQEEIRDTPPLMQRTHLKHDTYLSCWCPHCEAGLNEGDRAVFAVVNNRGEVGVSKVAAYLNVLEQETTLHVEDDEELTDVRCPRCQVSLIEPDQLCRQDGCKLVGIHVTISNSKRLKLVSCIRRSCRWYKMSEEDNERLILRDSHEW
jgi:hypothetical protein